MRKAIKNFIERFNNVSNVKVRRYTIEFQASNFASDGIKNALKTELPNATFEDVSDYIHKSTFRIVLDPNDTKRTSFERKYS